MGGETELDGIPGEGRKDEFGYPQTHSHFPFTHGQRSMPTGFVFGGV